MGVFLALDLFLFYFFWELMLVPLYFLIGFWGHENRVYASIKFFIFTQAGGLLMLLAILGLYFVHGRATGVYTFDYNQLLGTPMSESTARWLMLGFFAAFAVKLPAVPAAHLAARRPYAGADGRQRRPGRAGAEGRRLRDDPLPRAALPEGRARLLRRRDGAGRRRHPLRRRARLRPDRPQALVAYTSVSHMGFVLLGIFAWNELALEGAIMIMLAHGITRAPSSCSSAT